MAHSLVDNLPRKTRQSSVKVGRRDKQFWMRLKAGREEGGIKAPGLTGQCPCRQEDTGAGEEPWPGRRAGAELLV